MGWERLGKAQNGLQECCGNGLETLRMNHEKGFGCFMTPKSGVGMVSEGFKWSKGGWVFLMVPKNSCLK